MNKKFLIAAVILLVIMALVIGVVVFRLYIGRMPYIGPIMPPIKVLAEGGLL